MTITARYLDDAHTLVERSDMAGARIPATAENRHFADLLTRGVPIVAFKAEGKTREDVKREAHRRILSLCPEWRQRNMAVHGARLSAIGLANLSAEDRDQWNGIMAVWKAIDAIRRRSDEIEGMDPIPMDLSAESLWT